MRLFGKVNSAVDRFDRAEWITGPFDMALSPVAQCYRLYRGVGGISEVDFSTYVGHVLGGDASETFLSLGHAANTRYTYVLRPVRVKADNTYLETPDNSCIVEFETDDSGDWLGNRPGSVEVVEAEVLSGGQVRLRWRYRTPYSGSVPSDFGIYYGSSPGIAPGSPNTTESYTKDGGYSKTLSLTGGNTYYFAVTAMHSNGVESHLSNVIGPYIADSTAPDTPTLITSATF